MLDTEKNNPFYCIQRSWFFNPKDWLQLTMTKLQNCWEFMECGFGPDGGKTKTNGVCAAARKNRLDGAHGGKHAGRACWIVKDTLDCGQGVQGNFSEKYPICMDCRFYWKVREEEGTNFEVSLLLTTYMHDK